MTREMKDSGIEWIGEIPFAWKLVPFRYVLNERQEKNNPIKSRERLSLSIDLGVTLYAEKTTNLDRFKDDFEQYKIAHKGDLVMNSMNMIVGATGVSDYFGCVSPAYYTFYDELEDHVTAKYCEYIFRSKTMLRVLYSLGKGIYAIVRGDDRVNTCRLKVAKEDLKGIIIPIPSVEEQREIVKYLEKKCSEVDIVAEKTHSSIEEYKKLKQAIITQAVTKGVRGNRKMKDSQSTWFGQIPSDWEMRKIKYIFKIQKDIAGKEGHTVLSITQKGIKPKDLSKNEGQLAENYSNYQLVHIGDFAMNHMDLLTGWVDVSKYEGVTSPDYRVFELIDKDNYCSQYYLYLMQMCYANRIFYGLGQGVSGLGRWRLQADKFLNFSITVPSYEEQKEIANYLDQKCLAIDELIAKKEQYLSEIENYKKSLIYEYVTGKKEV